MSETQDTKTRQRRGDPATGLPDEQTAEDNAEKLRRDHFPVEKGDNQQDMDNTWETANPSGMSERDVKWPEVDSQEALDDKIDEAQTDKEQRIVETAQDADRQANRRNKRDD